MVKGTIFLSGQKEIRNKGVYKALIFFLKTCTLPSFFCFLKKCYCDSSQEVRKDTWHYKLWIEAQASLLTISVKETSTYFYDYQAIRYNIEKVMSKTQTLLLSKLCNLPSYTCFPFIDWLGLPGWLSSEESTCQCRKCGFDPCVGKIPWRRKWPLTPAFLPGKSHGQRSLAGDSLWVTKSRTWLSNWECTQFID